MKYTNSLLLIILPVVFAACGSEERYEPRVQRPEKAHRLKYVKFRSDFNDMNGTHLAAAQAIGIRPLATRDEIGNASRDLCFLDETLAYELENLTHSSPLLVPASGTSSGSLAQRDRGEFPGFSCNAHYSPYKIIVTSVLRTDEDVKKLSKRNINASKRSVHCYGTTFDITYKRFHRVDDEEPEVSQAKLKAVLGEVLLDLKKQGRCYVKHEIKQACFHITARN